MKSKDSYNIRVFLTWSIESLPQRWSLITDVLQEGSLSVINLKTLFMRRYILSHGWLKPVGSVVRWLIPLMLKQLHVLLGDRLINFSKRFLKYTNFSNFEWICLYCSIQLLQKKKKIGFEKIVFKMTKGYISRQICVVKGLNRQ